jgi:hypothetical protein
MLRLENRMKLDGEQARDSCTSPVRVTVRCACQLARIGSTSLSAVASEAGKTQDEERRRRWRKLRETDGRMEEEVAEEPGRMRREEFLDFGRDENDETRKLGTCH